MPSAAAEARCTPQIVTVLSIAAAGEDHSSLKDILGHSDPPMSAGCLWHVETSFTPRAAMEHLRARSIPIVLCENDQQPGAWKEMLDQMTRIPNPPCLIVTSRQADDRLWVEALNLGAYDVLAKPFDRSEVVRTLGNAWIHWSTRHRPKTATAA